MSICHCLLRYFGMDRGAVLCLEAHLQVSVWVWLCSGKDVPEEAGVRLGGLLYLFVFLYFF